MQCKDIPDEPILKFLLDNHGKWCTWGEGHSMPTVRDAMPPETPPKLQLAKMAMLMRRGLVTGCNCGCRGDFEITGLGIALVDPGHSLASKPSPPRRWTPATAEQRERAAQSLQRRMERNGETMPSAAEIEEFLGRYRDEGDEIPQESPSP